MEFVTYSHGQEISSRIQRLNYDSFNLLKQSFSIFIFLAIIHAILFVLIFALFNSYDKDIIELRLLLGIFVILYFLYHLFKFIRDRFHLLGFYWESVQKDEIGRTTPHKAKSFLLIPIFNLYWFWVAYYGLYRDMANCIDIHKLDIAKKPIKWKVLAFCSSVSITLISLYSMFVPSITVYAIGVFIVMLPISIGFHYIAASNLREAARYILDRDIINSTQFDTDIINRYHF